MAASSAPPRGPSATDIVRERAVSLEPASPDAAAWIPFEIIDAVDRFGGELGASSAPEIRGDRIVWSLVLPAVAHTPDPSTFDSVCTELTRSDPHLACAVDTFAVGAADRTRFAFSWRRASGSFRGDIALPLRALARMHTGACLVSAERTLRTLELKLQVADIPVLGRTLARLTAITPLNDLILVGMQPAQTPHGVVENVILSWPTDRVDRDRADLAGDPWPARCEQREVMSREAAAHSPITALFAIAGERAHGAVVNIAHREWLVTEGDVVADARVASIAPQGVYLVRTDRPNARPQLARLPPAARRPPISSSASPPPLRIPLPPEPPAPLP